VKALPTKAKQLKVLKKNGLYLKDPTHTYYALHHKFFPYFDVSIMLPQVPPCCREDPLHHAAAARAISVIGTE
jgi:hypothetical protein